ncbi:MAG: retropepsin-like aspartic protease [Candidatus Omnitrophota bacterium]
MIRRTSVVFVLLMMFGLQLSRADTVYLKNKHEMEGIVTVDDEERIVLDVGSGTITIMKNEIDHIVTSDPRAKEEMVRSWQDRYAQSGRWIPAGAETIYAQIGEIKAARESVLETTIKKERLQEEVAAQQKDLADAYANFEELNKVLAGADRSDVYNYNKIIAQVNAGSARIGRLTAENNAGARLQKAQEVDFSNTVNKYTARLLALAGAFDREHERAMAAGIPDKDAGFYRWARREIDDLGSDLETKEIPCAREAGGLIVAATVNGTATLSLAVDTGASLMVISRRTAADLGIAIRDDGKKIDLLLADDKKTTAFPVILESVEVGGLRVRHVMAAVTDEAPAPGIDGLLGMSFLGNFIVRIDANRNKVILERFIPKK